MRAPRTQAITARVPPALIVAAIILALLLAAALLAFGWYVLRAIATRQPWLADTLLIALPLSGALLLVSYGALLALGAYNRWAGRTAAQADKAAALMRAQVQVAPLASSLHYEITNDAPTIADPRLLAPPIECVKPLDEWMRWADEQPHILLSGKTKAGKTHLATAILERRLRAGERVFIIDPHSSGWLSLPTAGSVSNPNELKFALVALLAEYTRRMQEREDYKKSHNGLELPHDHFGRMTVLIDEANAIAEQLDTVWSTFAKQLASGSRKVGIALLIMAQSPNVDDIGFSAKMRNNFAAIALDAATVQSLIDKERSKERTIAMRQAAHDMTYPAAAFIGDLVWLLDRSELPVGRQPAGALSLMWGGWDYQTGRAVSSLSGDSSGNEPLPPTTRIGNDVSDLVTSLGADSSAPLPVPVTPAEAAKIAILLAGNPPSEAAKKLDGYSPRKYAEYKAKVDQVVALLEGI